MDLNTIVILNSVAVLVLLIVISRLLFLRRKDAAKIKALLSSHGVLNAVTAGMGFTQPERPAKPGVAMFDSDELARRRHKKVNVCVVGDGSIDICVPVDAKMDQIQDMVLHHIDVCGMLRNRRVVKTVVRENSVEIFPERIAVR